MALFKPEVRAKNEINALIRANVNDYRKYKPICKKIARAITTAMRKLRTGWWPPESRRPVVRLVKALSRERAAYAECGRALSIDQVFEAFDPKPWASREATRVALSLGLQPK